MSLHEGDCMDVLAGLDEASVDAVICDPPYHQASIVKRFGKAGAAPPKPGVYRRFVENRIGRTWDMPELHQGDCMEVLAGLDEASVDAVVTDPPYGIHFMGQAWDRPTMDAAVAAYRPGEQPGWHSRHTTLSEDQSFQAWTEQWAALALRALKPGGALLAMGATRLYHRTACGIQDAGFEVRDCLAWLYGSGFPKSHNGAWGGTALKPAWEPVVVARKPLDGTHAANHERWGTGGIDVDAMRVPLNGDTVPEFAYAEGFDPKPGRTAEQVAKQGWSSRQVGRRGGMSKDEVAWRKPRNNTAYNPIFDINRGPQAPGDDCAGRWPANVAHDGSEAVVGELPHTASGGGDEDGLMYPKVAYDGPSLGRFAPQESSPLIGDAGSAARFFYTAKPSRTEKEAGLAGVDEQTNPHRERESNYARQGRATSLAKEQPTRRNIHPTCKPIELFRWLIRGFVPRGGLVLDPFAGSGTTAIAAVLEGRRWIAIEREREYAEIARARIEWWAREAARKPGRSVAEILGEVALPKRQAKDGPVQGALL